MSEERKKIIEELAADGTCAGVEAEEDGPYPFEAEKINITNKPIPLEALVRRLKQGTISSPLIQRGAGLWDNGQQSRLIESLMLKIPLPLFYVAADEDEKWKVVDGLQRVTAIRRFILDQEFKLTDLEFMTNLTGVKFDELPQKFQNRILETELQFAIIDPATPSNVQRNVFKRLNTGGLPLTPQEIRHALYYGPGAELLKVLADSKEFKLATTNGVNDSRMAGRELVLRFLSFLLRGNERYSRKGDMDAFLSETMQILNKLPEITENDMEKICAEFVPVDVLRYLDITDLVYRFKLAMDRAQKLFSRHAFRKSIPVLSQNRTPINKSLFEVWAVSLSEMTEELFLELLENKDLLYNEMYFYTYEDVSDVFSRSISRDSHKVSGVRTRYDLVQKMIDTALGIRRREDDN